MSDRQTDAALPKALAPIQLDTRLFFEIKRPKCSSSTCMKMRGLNALNVISSSTLFFAKEKQSEKARRSEIRISIIRTTRCTSRACSHWAASFSQWQFERVYHREASRTPAACSSFFPLDKRWRWISIALQTWRQSQGANKTLSVLFALARTHCCGKEGRIDPFLWLIFEVWVKENVRWIRFYL